jgi:DNA-binding LacI/PurR family transcriptional regulator
MASVRQASKAAAGRKDVPFTVSRNVKTGLVEQVVCGLRQAIRGGFYKPGDVIAPVRDLAVQLGVSVRITAAAVKALAAEGLVSSRPRTGSVVLSRNENSWKGSVLLIMPEGFGYYHSELGGRIRETLAGAGYACMQVSVPGVCRNGRNCRYDVSSLEFMLGHRVDFAVLFFECAAAAKILRRYGVEYVSIGYGDSRLPNGAGSVIFDYGKAFCRLAERCRELGIKTAVQVCKGGAELSAVRYLSSAGVRVERKVITPRRDGMRGRLWDIQKATLELFREWTGGDGFAWPDLIYVSDDYAATAAIIALGHLGVKIPDDVRLVVFSNRGHGPVAWNSLARIENDVRGHGDIVSAAVLSFLENGTFPSDIRLEAAFIPGDSL